MLSAFTAKPIVELKQRDKSKIESILAYGDRVLVGLNSGALRVYRVNEETGEQPAQASAADLLREEDKFSRRPVVQLGFLKEISILISLSDGHVSIHDLHTYALQERLEKTRGATTFAAASNIVKDPTTGIPSIVSRLAVAVKRRIVLWTWRDTELSGDATELSLMASVKSLTWAAGTKLVAGMDPGFVLVDVDTHDVQDVVKPGDAGGQGGVRFGAVQSSGMGYMGMASWVPKPLATRLGEGQLLLAKDVNSLFIDTAGNALDRRQVPWPSAPEMLAYSYPYMLALQAPAKGSLEVRNPDTLNLLQSIGLPNASFLHVPQPNISLAHQGKGFLVASDRCIWRMAGQSYEAQLDQLAASRRYDEALSLLRMLEDTLLQDKDGRVRETKMLKAEALFDDNKWVDAMDLFIDAKAPPERVIALYPRAVAGDLSHEDSATGHGSVADGDVDGDDNNDDDERESEKPADDSEEIKKTSRESTFNPAATIGRSVMGRLVGGHKKADSDAASIRSSARDDAAETASIRPAKKVTETTQPDKQVDFSNALRALQSYLAQCRVQIKRYMDTDGNLKEPLPEPSDSQQELLPKPPFHHFIQETSGHVDWVARLLDVAQLVDTTLFRAYMLTKSTLAGSLFRLPNFCEPDVVQEKLYETGRYADLIDFLHGKKLHRHALELLEKFGKNEADEEVAPALQGPQRTVGYLQQLPPEMIDLILEFAEWPLRTDPALGMDVFLADTQNAEELPRHQVLAFLEGLDLKLAVKYLEHVIEELNDLTPDFHQKLVDLFLERLRSGEFEDEAEKGRWRERLQTFLKTSGSYNNYRVFKQLSPDDPDFFESRAIVLSKMGQHKQALQIYVFQLKDYDKAEEYAFLKYCNTIFLTTPPPEKQPDPQDHTIYHTLLALYLSPPPPHAPNLTPALDLLSKHGARLPASTTLDLVPPSLPVRDLASYFRGRIRAANSRLNEERIVARLRGVEKVGVEMGLLLGFKLLPSHYPAIALHITPENMVRTMLLTASLAGTAFAAVCSVAGGTSDDSAAIKAALKSCNNGGTVVLDKTYTIGSLLQTTDLSNIAIQLSGTIKLSANIDFWSSNGFQLNYQNAYTAWTIGGSNIHIYGGGTYSGSGDTWYSAGKTGPIPWVIYNAQNVVVDNIKQVQSPFWHNLVYGSSNVTFNNIDLHSIQTSGKQAQNTDGWDIYRSDNVRITNSHIVNGDDCVSFKPNTTNTLVENLYCQGSHGISVGSLGQYAGVQDIVANVLVKNVTMVNAENGARIKAFGGSASSTSTTGGGNGYVRNVTFQDFTVQSVALPVVIDQCYETSASTCASHPSKVTISDVHYVNVTGTGSKSKEVVSLVCSDVCQGVTATGTRLHREPGFPLQFCWSCGLWKCGDDQCIEDKDEHF
ncbi:glycoside hydrolase family 28 protein [Didymella exigua CBS 183.55]|uniref:Glycoside hydrolase family 28 protein n=1 Tax=Didymella exigua CBS 183.55 TaxID=1150837 RepID=A0A6A5RBD7_9PLEO|nr:glycoside hydrolase family 28 protein [Didymella exigua CBS 183.55]KAF1924659.1 glycoside hydrolase family 28 protein [Didymella exigua CBS 183.55]